VHREHGSLEEFLFVPAVFLLPVFALFLAVRHMTGVLEAGGAVESCVARRAAEGFHWMRCRRREIQIQIVVRLEWLRRVLISLLINAQMAGVTAVDAWDRLEWLIVVEVVDDDLLDALRRVHEIEYRSIAERRYDQAGIQRSQASLQPGVIGQHRL